MADGCSVDIKREAPDSLLCFHFFLLRFCVKCCRAVLSIKNPCENFPAFDQKLIFRQRRRPHAALAKGLTLRPLVQRILLLPLSKLPFDRGNQFGGSGIRFCRRSESNICSVSYWNEAKLRNVSLSCHPFALEWEESASEVATLPIRYHQGRKRPGL